MYIQKEIKAGNTVEIQKYFCYHAPPPGGRHKKEKPSPEKLKKLNKRKAAERLRWIMNTNFKDGDLLLTLDFYKNKPVDSQEMQVMTAKAFRKMKKLNKDVKYIYVKEIGKRGGRHVHAVISGLSLADIQKAWTYGSAHATPLFSDGQYRKIADYFTKYSEKTEETEGELVGKRYYGSRNLEKPQITRKVISASSFRKDPKVKKGYYLDKDSLVEGISDITGYAYQYYTMIKAGGQDNDS